MPVRIPNARMSEVLCFGAAGVTGFAPFYLMVPGAEERLATQTARWAPRWERNITFFKSPVERGIQRVTPPVERTVRKIDDKLPLERVVKKVNGRLERGMKRAGLGGHGL